MQNVPSPSAAHLGNRVCEFAWIVFVFISLSHFIHSFSDVQCAPLCVAMLQYVGNLNFYCKMLGFFFCSNAGDNDYIMGAVQRENNSTRREFAVRCECRTEIKSLPLLLEIHGYAVRRAIQAIDAYVFPVRVKKKSHSNNRTHGAASCDVWNVHKLLVFSKGI